MAEQGYERFFAFVAWCLLLVGWDGGTADAFGDAASLTGLKDVHIIIIAGLNGQSEGTTEFSRSEGIGGGLTVRSPHLEQLDSICMRMTLFGGWIEEFGKGKFCDVEVRYTGHNRGTVIARLTHAICISIRALSPHQFYKKLTPSLLSPQLPFSLPFSLPPLTPRLRASS